MGNTGNSIEEQGMQTRIIEENDLELMRKNYEREVNRFKPFGAVPKEQEQFRHLVEVTDMKWVNEIIEAPCAKLVIHQFNLNNPNIKPKKRADWSADGVHWVNNFADALWNAGVGQ